MTEEIKVEMFVEKSMEGKYFKIPLEVPESVSKIDIYYSYKRFEYSENQNCTSRQEVNVIDFGLEDSGGNYIGSSGSDREYLWVSGYDSSQGFKKIEPEKGVWNILAGAYKVEDRGVFVTYKILFAKKERMLLKGDPHIHTDASDGNMSLSEVISASKSIGLDFIGIADHNNTTANRQIPWNSGISVIPGMEWTHYKGHALFLGKPGPFDSAMYANTSEQAIQAMKKAMDMGALVPINHPFFPGCQWELGFEKVPFNCVEVWNSMPKGSELAALKWWQAALSSGKKIPVIGGSDFHKLGLFGVMGTPTTWVYAQSKSPEDIVYAMRKGHCFISLTPQGPICDISCGDYSMGDTVAFESGKKALFTFDGLIKGDTIKIYSSRGVEFTIETTGEFKRTEEIDLKANDFLRAEVYRTLMPGMQPVLAMVSNPIYVDLRL
jgi:hypothetical protein